MANLDQKHLVHEAHEEYLLAGAGVITTNSYACVPSIVGDRERTLEAIRAAGAISRAAADQHNALVAGCLPPLRESYRADRVGPNAELEEEYALIARTIAPYSDVLLCETMSCAREAVAAARAAAPLGLPVWVSWTLGEDASCKLPSGESVEEAVDALRLAEGGPVRACLLNCSQPEAISAALPRLRSRVLASTLTGAYANGFRTVKSTSGVEGSTLSEYREDLSPERYAELCLGWATDGSTIFGGCCGVFPEHIAAVARALAAAPKGREDAHSSTVLARGRL